MLERTLATAVLAAQAATFSENFDGATVSPWLQSSATPGSQFGTSGGNGLFTQDADAGLDARFFSTDPDGFTDVGYNPTIQADAFTPAGPEPATALLWLCGLAAGRQTASRRRATL